MIRFAVAVAVAVATTGNAVSAQDSTASHPILIELRVGKTEILGYPGRFLIGPDDAIGLTAVVQLSRNVGVWASADHRPLNSSVLYSGPTLSPAVSLYALTAGISHAVGPAFGRSGWRPMEIGVGLGATKVHSEWRGNQVTAPPSDAPVENPGGAGLLQWQRWRPTAAARLRLNLPLGRAVALSATAALTATPVGDVRLWNGGWERSADDTMYRATWDTWRYRTVVALPLTLGVGVRF